MQGHALRFRDSGQLKKAGLKISDEIVLSSRDWDALHEALRAPDLNNQALKDLVAFSRKRLVD